MAKRGRKRSPRKTRTRTVTVTKYRNRPARKSHRRGRRRGGHRGGGFGGLMPHREELANLTAAGVYGLIERKAKTDQSFVLNTIVAKSPIPQIGFTGNIALAARLVNHFAFRHPHLRRFAQVTGEIAIYQMARQGALFTSVAPFTVSGEMDDDRVAGEIDGDDMGALAADADAYDLEGDSDDDLGEDPDALEVMAGETD